MQLKLPASARWMLACALLLAPCFADAKTPSAEAPEPAKTPSTAAVHAPVVDAAVKGALYFQKDSGGNERVDEDARVFEALIVVKGHASPNDTISARALVDVVTAASIKREHNSRFRALQSGASGVVHLGAGLGYHHEFETVGLGLNGSYAWEYAYRSVGAAANAVWHTDDKNTTIGLAIQSFFDDVLMIRYNGDNEADKTRTTLGGTLHFTQILTPESLLTVSFEHTQQFGFLATQFNSVWVDGKETYEALPDGRARESLTGRYKHGVFEADAIEAGLRYYHDDWGADAGTADLRYFLSLLDRKILLETNYRFHLQTAVDAYRKDFPTQLKNMTSDPDLGEFMAHMVGLKASFTDLDLLGLHSTWDISGNYYHRDNGLQMFWFQLGYRFQK